MEQIEEFDLEKRVDVEELKILLDRIIKKNGVKRDIFGLRLANEHHDSGTITYYYDENDILAVFKYDLIKGSYKCKLKLDIPQNDYDLLIYNIVSNFSYLMSSSNTSG